MDRFAVLMYHRIVSERCPVPGGDSEEARYAVGLPEFTWQMEYMADTGRRAVSMRLIRETLASGKSVPADWVGVTFDDGNLSDFVHAREILSKRGFEATFFVGGDRVGADGGLTAEMLAGLAEEGMDIGSHGMTHRFLTDLSAQEEDYELARSKELLERVSGVVVECFAPPGGRIGQRGVEALKRLSYRSLCTSEFGFNRSTGNRYDFRRIPVTAATTRGRFREFVELARFRLLPLYARDRGLRAARRVLGEAGYRRVRSLGLRS